MLRHAQLRTSDFIKAIPELAGIPPHILSRVDIDGTLDFTSPISPFRLKPVTGRYSSHLYRQEADLRTFLDDESLTLDPRIDYNLVPGLSIEARERLFAVRPTSIVSHLRAHICFTADCKLQKGAVKRMDGMTPTSIVYLLRFAKRRLKDAELTASL